MTDPTMCLSSTNTFHWGWSEKNRLNCSLGGGGSVSRKGREVQTHPTHLVAAVESGKIFSCGRTPPLTCEVTVGKRLHPPFPLATFLNVSDYYLTLLCVSLCFILLA